MSDHRRSAALRNARTAVWSGLGLALFLTLFVDIAIMAVPLGFGTAGELAGDAARRFPATVRIR
jgi:hypothetical protein